MNDDGSYGIGFILGFLLGLIGIIIACAIGKSRTIKGSVIGICTDIGVALFIVIIAVCSSASTGGW